MFNLYRSLRRGEPAPAQLMHEADGREAAPEYAPQAEAPEEPRDIRGWEEG